MERILLVVLSLVLFSLLFLMLRGDKESRLGVTIKGQSFIEGLKIVHRQNGREDWILTAKRADIDDKADKALLSDMMVKIPEKGISVHAEKGTYDMTTRHLTVKGKTVAKGDSYSIASEGVEFDGDGGGLKADGSVLIESKKFTVEGTGMDADNEGQTMRIRKDVKAIFHN